MLRQNKSPAITARTNVSLCVCLPVEEAEPKRVCILTDLRCNNAAMSSLQDQADGDESSGSFPFRLGLCRARLGGEQGGGGGQRNNGSHYPHPLTCRHTVHQCHFAGPHLFFIPSLFGCPNNRPSRWKLQLSGVKQNRSAPLLYLVTDLKHLISKSRC